MKSYPFFWTSLIKWFLSFCAFILLAGCGENLQGELLFIEEDSQKGFNYPYFLFLPDGVSEHKETMLIVEPNNSGFASNNFEEHVEKARRVATREFYIGNYLSRKAEYPLLIPVFNRPKSNWKIYTHSLDRDVMLQKGNSLERLDLQLIEMVDDARSKLAERQIKTKKKFFLTGFSASGLFANRFSLIHPEKVQAVAAGGLNGLLMLPKKEHQGEILNYPLGINDFETLFEKEFDLLAFKEVPQFWYMGELDENDAVPYDDAYDEDERQVVYAALGREMQPQRWDNCRKVYSEEGVKARVRTYEGVGHEHPEVVKEDIYKFFKANLAEGSSAAFSHTSGSIFSQD